MFKIIVAKEFWINNYNHLVSEEFAKEFIMLFFHLQHFNDFKATSILKEDLYYSGIIIIGTEKLN